jgi:phosphatidylglycerol:prolipoprotein diacylglycerol transferase
MMPEPLHLPVFVIPFPDIDPVLIHFGPFGIRWYALGYIVGILVGWRYARRLVANTALWRRPPGSPAALDELLIWVAVGVAVGGRLGQVLLYEPSYYFANPIEIPQVWHGGMAFHGGLIGAALAVILFAWRHGIPMLSYLDVVAAVAPIGLFLVRLANFINGELWGRVTDVPWAMVFPRAGPEPRHPSQLYEAALEGILLFALLATLVRLRGFKRPGLVTGSFAVGYAVARSVAELFREPDGVVYGPITIGMAYSAPMVAVGLGLILHAWRRNAPQSSET